MGASDVSTEFIDRIENIFTNYPGKCSVEITVEDKNENMSIKMFSKSKKIAISTELMHDLNKLSGVECELR